MSDGRRHEWLWIRCSAGGARQCCWKLPILVADCDCIWQGEEHQKYPFAAFDTLKIFSNNSLLLPIEWAATSGADKIHPTDGYRESAYRVDGWIDHSWKESFWWNPAIAIWSAQKSWLGALAGLAVQKQGEGFNKTDWLLWRRGFMRGESKGENERAMALWNLCSISRILKMWVMGSLVQQELKKFWHCPEETKLQNIGHLSLDILVLHTQLTSFDSKMFLSGGKDPTLTCWLNWG